MRKSHFLWQDYLLRIRLCSSYEGNLSQINQFNKTQDKKSTTQQETVTPTVHYMNQNIHSDL